MARDPEFLILKPGAWLPEQEWKQVLGAAVLNHLSPLSDSVPKNPLRYDKNRLTEFTFEDTVAFQGSVNNSAGEFELNGLGKLRWNKTKQNNIDLSSKVIYVKRLKQHSEFWFEINKDAVFKQTVAQWVGRKKLLGKSKHQVCLVVGVLMCQDVVVATSDEEVRERELKGEEPLGTIAGLAAASQGFTHAAANQIGNASASTSAVHGRKTYFAGGGKGKRVFALELRIIKSRKGNLELSDNTPKSDRKLDAEQSAVDPESLELQHLEPQDWEDLFLEEEEDDVDG